MQTGIRASSEFLQEWAAIREDKSISFIKIRIINETFAIVERGQTAPGEDGFAAARKVLLDNEVSFVVVRVEDKFALVFYVPETSRVADKMTYAGSIARLKADLMWNDFIGKEIYATVPSECENPRTSASRAAAAAQIAAETRKSLEAAYESSHIGYATEVKLTADLELGVDDKLVATLTKVREGELSGAILSIDLATETIRVEKEYNSSTDDESLLSQIKQAFPSDAPRYALFNFTGTGSNAGKRGTAFIYYCPDQGPHKPRMVYSATKATALRYAQVEAYEGKSTFVRVQKSEVADLDLAEIRKQAFGADEGANKDTTSTLANATTLNRPKAGVRAGGIKKLGSGIEF